MQPPPLTFAGALSSWQFDPVPIALILLLGGWYLLRVRRYRRGGARWPGSRTLWFFLGLLVYALVTLSAIAVYDRVLFSARALQIVGLLMIVPQLFAHGLPLTLARDTASPAGRRIGSTVLHHRLTELITHPIVGLLVLLGLPIALYATGWYAASLTDSVIAELTRFALLAGGFHYFWTRLQRDPVPKPYAQYITTWLTFADIILDAIVPLAMITMPGLVAEEYYTALGRDWGISLRMDQVTGAGLLWFLGDLAGLPFLLLSLQQLRRRDRADTEAIDAELDALEPEQRVAEGRVRPWWEEDESVAEHFGWRR
ncbi:cytochrome c oxidase assembly protein [Sciscionella sediminilitoris]|uniref:cytochrome c oxidase assembly protein n=1 Tax=Sciscionella sediminilitoris TaxID=1445613 RepID=UPI00055B039C|nr:cytochrome c oxidase assembly protein [Sciscionella sp. SE31]